MHTLLHSKFYDTRKVCDFPYLRSAMQKKTNSVNKKNKNCMLILVLIVSMILLCPFINWIIREYLFDSETSYQLPFPQTSTLIFHCQNKTFFCSCLSTMSGIYSQSRIVYRSLSRKFCADFGSALFAFSPFFKSFVTLSTNGYRLAFPIYLKTIWSKLNESCPTSGCLHCRLYRIRYSTSLITIVYCYQYSNSGLSFWIVWTIHHTYSVSPILI